MNVVGLSRNDRRVEVEYSLPDSITTWEVNAVSTAPLGGICASEPLEIVAFKNVFVEINVPYSVRKNEQVEIPATVYNYGQKTIKVRRFALCFHFRVASWRFTNAWTP